MTENDVTVARQFQSFIYHIAEQRAIAHAQSRLAEQASADEEERNYARMEYVFIEVHQKALSYALEPQSHCTTTLNILGMDAFAQFCANEIMMQIQCFDMNDLTDASRRGWLIAYVEWARCASMKQCDAVKSIREVEKAQQAVRDMHVSHLLDM